MSREVGMLEGKALILSVLLIVCTKPPSSLTPVGMPK